MTLSRMLPDLKTEYSIQAYLEAAGPGLVQALPDQAHVILQLHGDGGGTWTLERRGTRLAVVRGRGQWTDSLLACDVERFVQLVTNELDARTAFLDGTVRVEGDVGLLLRLHKVLSSGN